jgi:uncharacterized protein with von Willebrand factor type A (vWA) domain
MQNQLINFINTLRKHDVRVSTSESLDAMRALALIGYRDRQQLKIALGYALAKTIEEKSIYNTCFELFYGGERLLISDITIKESAHMENSDMDLESEISADSNIQSAIKKPLVTLLLEEDSAQISAAIAQAASNLSIENLRYFTQTGQYTRKILEQVDIGQVDESIQELRAIDTLAANTLSELLNNKKQKLRALAKQHIDEIFLLTANTEGKKIRENVLRSARLSSLEHRHFNQLQSLVQKLAKKLSARHSHRLHINRRGKLDVTKTLRKNIQNDGILFETHWKKKRKDQPKVIALCDVSNSVAAYAKFLLLFLYSLNDVLPKIRSFCFSNRTGEVTQLFDQYEAAQAIDMAFKRWGQGSSDYGQSLVDFSTLCKNDIDNNTTVIILGDARNNRGEARLDILQGIYQNAKHVIWLNPESRSSWGTGDSEIRRYQTACHFVTECQSLQQLERVIDQLLKAIK